MKHTGVKARKAKLWIRVKDAAGAWVWQNTPFRVGQEKQASKLRQMTLERMAAGVEVMGDEKGPVTVAAWSKRWIKDRPGFGVRDWEKDEQRLRDHVLPLIGKMVIADVRAKHLAGVVRSWRAKGFAARTIRNCYSTTRSMFRDAQIEGLIDANPCVLTHRQLGKIQDKDPAWRATAIYTRNELELLVSHPGIPLDRRVAYGLLGLAGARHEEMASVRWRQYDPKAEPLGRLNFSDSKAGGVVRPAPVHPVLAALLAEWHLEGFQAALGRAPKPDDLIVPRAPAESLQERSRTYTHWRAKKYDFPATDMRPRRMHDMRRTFISLLVEAGYEERLVKRITHKAPTDVIGLYTTIGWEKLCEMVLSLEIARRGRAGLGHLGHRRAISRDLKGAADRTGSRGNT